MADLTWHQIDSDGAVRFRSAGHASASFLRALYENGIGFDVELFGTVAADNNCAALQPVRAHRMILKHASKYLHEMFMANRYTDSHQTQYKITDISHESVRDIVKFIYTDELEFPAECAPERMQQVLIGAKFWGMPELAKACETFLASNQHLNVQSCMCMLRLARKYACLLLLDVALNLAARNLSHLMDDSNFLNLNEEEVTKLLLSEPVITLAVPDHRCRIAVAWLNHDRASRDACVVDILSLVPFDLNTISLDTLAALKNNDAIRTQYAEKFMNSIFDGVAQNYERGCNKRYYANNTRAISDVWLNADKSSSRDMWYVMGGFDAPKEFVAYDVTRRHWSKVGSLPWRRAGAAACVMDGKNIFLFGGEKRGEISAEINKFDLYTHTWAKCSTAKLSVARFRAGACVSTGSNEQCAYVCGGRFNTEEANRLVEKMYFGENDVGGKLSIRLQSMPEMCVGRYNITATYASDAVFVAGGRCEEMRSPLRLSSIEKYDCVVNKWSIVGELKGGGRSGMMAALLGDDDLYLAGGYNGNRAVNAVEIFNIRTGQLRQAPSMLSARCSGGGVALDRNTFCVVGGGRGVGRANVSSLRSVECFDVREGKWSTGVIVPNMPTANRHFSFARVE